MTEDKDKNDNRAGYLLVEAMVAITIATVGLMSLVGLLSRSLSLNRVSSNKIIANYLAAEGIEIVRNFVDSNYIKDEPWNNGISSGEYELDYRSAPGNLAGYNPDNYIKFDDNSGFYGYDSGTATLYRRRVVINTVGADEIQVNSFVAWTDRGGANLEVNIEDHFFDWRKNI